MSTTEMTDLQLSPAESAVEAETQRIGKQLFEHLHRRQPTIFERRWWDDRIMNWAMSDESVKVQMFRFVDVLPMLKGHEDVTGHLQEYFEDVQKHLPWAGRLAMSLSQPNTILGRAISWRARSEARRMAQRFIAGTTVEEVLAAVARLRKQGFAFTLDLLGEAIISEREADAYQKAYMDLIEGLAGSVNNWPENLRLDREPAIPSLEQRSAVRGQRSEVGDQRSDLRMVPIPRVNVSLKLSALYSQFNPADPKGTYAGVCKRLRPLLRAAMEHDAYIHVDMEQYEYKDLTLQIFKDVLMEEEFRDFPHTGIVIQAYLPEAEQDLRDLRQWAEERGTPVWVRLVKGAYWDYETVMAKSNGWPIPVYRQKWQSDENFERQARYLMENYQWLRPALGSHNLRSLANGLAWAKQLDVPKGALEIQMLYGMGEEEARLFTEMGHRVRIYTPFGELIPGMAYLVRRLLENTSNDSFLRQSFTEQVSVEELMMNPTKVGETTEKPQDSDPGDQRDFQNEPHTDFSQSENREAMQKALDEVADELGRDYSLVINGRAVETSASILSRNPSHAEQIVGKVSSATPDDAVNAIEAARRAFKHWARLEPNYRAEYLELVAAEMRNRRFELAAWEVYEGGKPWREADADVAEAIDFCVYYAQQMRKMAVPRQCDVPGEENTYSYRPRGVAVVIAPWNFPLAILTGMTAAALVTGNTVIMKPAEQSPVIAAKLMEIFQNVEIPPGVVNYLPGIGEEVGPELVGNPDVDLIAFTGSREVGLQINRTAGDTDSRQTSVKKVIAEMGGKNAIVIDSDADLDEAVLGVVNSAFGYSGQKCSACSRAIVLEPVYDQFLDRLIEATKSLKFGPAEQPGTKVGPVIDEEARDRILEYIAIGREEATPVVETPLAELEGEGYYIGPHVFADVEPDARIAQEEIFGPVLAVIQARDLDHALTIANNTDYALTGGIFSRSPANLKKARQEFLVGNLYLNRGCTGALVERQPFGGFKMSGIGTKAGGPDYLREFVIPVNVTENTMRRGFAPPPDDEA